MMLTAHADPQLRRLERSIAELETGALAVRMRKQWLLLAFQRERAELLNYRRTPMAIQTSDRSHGLWTS